MRVKGGRRAIGRVSLPSLALAAKGSLRGRREELDDHVGRAAGLFPYDPRLPQTAHRIENHDDVRPAEVVLLHLEMAVGKVVFARRRPSPK